MVMRYNDLPCFVQLALTTQPLLLAYPLPYLLIQLPWQLHLAVLCLL